MGPVFAAIVYVFATMTLLFGTSYLFALAMVFFAFSVGVTVGQVAVEVMKASMVGSSGVQAKTPTEPAATGADA